MFTPVGMVTDWIVVFLVNAEGPIAMTVRPPTVDEIDRFVGVVPVYPETVALG